MEPLTFSDLKSLKFDYNNCEHDPIHLPGSIQPHGLLFVLQPPDLKIIQVSKNVDQFLDISYDKLLNQNIDTLIKEEQTNIIKKYLDKAGIKNINPFKLTAYVSSQSYEFNAIIHRIQEVMILELEPETTIQQEKEKDNFISFYHQIREVSNNLQNAVTLEKMWEVAATEVRNITGFDRVMVYQFDAEENGCVIAEDKREDLESFLGLNYPATDISAQARQLFQKNILRFIVDVNYQPVEIVPSHNPENGEPLDLSYAVLRSVSPFHREYLQNMGVGACMIIALSTKEKLWGLIACHHQVPKYIPYEIRKACEFISQVMSLEIAAKKQNEDYEYQLTLKSINARLVEYMTKEPKYLEGLLNFQPNLLNVVNAQGAIIKFGDQWASIGKIPQRQQLNLLQKWLQPKLVEPIYYTDKLSKNYSPAVNFQDVASGLLAISLSPSQNSYIVWFREEVIQTVNWAGSPSSNIQIEQDNRLRLSPRKSFALWKEKVKGKSLPWKECEIESALDLRNAIISVILKQAEELAILNAALRESEGREREKSQQLEIVIQQLQRTQTELIQSEKMSSLGQLVAGVAHEINNPINFIYGNLSHATTYTEDLIELLDLYVHKSFFKDIEIEQKEEEIELDFIKEDLPRLLTSMGTGAERICDLVQSLKMFSRLDEAEMKPVNIHDGINSTLVLLSHRLKPRTDYPAIEVIKDYGDLPLVECYAGSLNQVFMNLLTNALDTLEQSIKQRSLIEIKDNPCQITIRTEVLRQRLGEWVRICIGDNGPGLPKELVAQIFNSVYTPSQEGQKNRLGLAISYQIIVEKHKGNFHCLSRAQQGTEFQIEIPVSTGMV